MIDFKWQSCGGVLIGPDGDIDITTNNPMDSIIDMIRTRMKASLNAWKLYPIGADLESYIGTISNQELELSIQRRILTALTYQFLPQGLVTVKTLPIGNTIQIFIYVQNQLSVSAEISTNGSSLTVT